jgi:hypothetical protein
MSTPSPLPSLDEPATPASVPRTNGHHALGEVHRVPDKPQHGLMHVVEDGRTFTQAEILRVESAAGALHAVEANQQRIDGEIQRQRDAAREAARTGHARAKARADQVCEKLRKELDSCLERLPDLRGALRIAVLDAVKAARLRASASWWTASQEVARAGAVLDAMDKLADALAPGSAAIDPLCVWWQSQLLAPDVPLRTLGMKVYEANWRHYCWQADSVQHREAVRVAQAKATNELTATVAHSGAVWPF